MLGQFIYRLLIFASLAVTIISCEEPVELDIDIPEAKLVLSSNFFPDELVKVRVSSTINVLSKDIDFPDVNNARVTLFSAANTILEELVYVPGDDSKPGYYSTVDFKPSIGTNYEIHVSAPNYPLARAMSSIPPPVSIDDLDVSNVQVDQDGEYDIYKFGIDLSYDDPAEEGNYYNLRILQRLNTFFVHPNGDTSRTGYVVIPVIFPAAPSGEWIVAAQYGGILIKDRPFAESLHLELESPIFRDTQLLGNLTAELRTVSQEYYDFQSSLSEQIITPEGDLAPPIIIRSNVQNGAGVFAGYASSSYNFVLIDP
ncbi:MAG: DUF4249 domain-containing protein [Bacteroidota bacterium]